MKAKTIEDGTTVFFFLFCCTVFFVVKDGIEKPPVDHTVQTTIPVITASIKDTPPPVDPCSFPSYMGHTIDNDSIYVIKLISLSRKIHLSAYVPGAKSHTRIFKLDTLSRDSMIYVFEKKRWLRGKNAVFHVTVEAYECDGSITAKCFKVGQK